MDDLDLVLKALGTQCKPIVSVVETYTYAEKITAYKTAITTLANIGGGEKQVYLGVGVALQRVGADKKAIDAALRQLGKL